MTSGPSRAVRTARSLPRSASLSSESTPTAVEIGALHVSVAAVSRFLAVLAVAALAGGLTAWVGVLTRARWLDALRPVALRLALLVSAVAVSGSLYYSEVAHYTPCRLCWYQRIGIYPLVVLLAVAVIRRRTDVAGYVIPLAVITAPISVYHYLLQLYPSLEGSSCDPAAPCNVRWVHELGFVSIPFMAFATVVAVSGLVMAARPDGPVSERTSS